MAINDMVVFNETITGVTIETLAQMIDKFNAASGGSIVLSADGFSGDFMMQSFFTSIHSAQRRVDRYKTNDAAAVTPLQQAQLNGVKVAGGFGPILFEPGQMTWIRQAPARAVQAIAENMAQAILADMLNTCIAAVVAAMRNNSSVTLDVSGLSPTEGISHFNLNKAHALFGDHSGSIIAHVMRGTTAHKLIGQNITNQSQLFVAGNVRILDILGRIVVVTDAPALFESASPTDLEIVAALTSGAVTAYDPGDLITNIETSNGKERIETTYQADYTFGVGMKGYSWDDVNGGKSPTDAELTTGTNWDQTVTSHKHTAGVVLIGDASVE